jgi:hypothetical protein
MYVANLPSHARVAAMGPLYSGLVFFTSVVTIRKLCVRQDEATHAYKQTYPNLIIKIRGNGNEKERY